MGFFDIKPKKKNLEFSEANKVLDSLPTPPPLVIMPGQNKQVLPSLSTINLPEPQKPVLQNIPLPPASAQAQGFQKPVQPGTFSVPSIQQSNPTFDSMGQSFAATRSLNSLPQGIPKESIKPTFDFYKPEKLPTFTEKKMPQQLPSFNIPLKSGKPIDVEVPAPPPNLRSEISPIELERLEEKYLDRRPKISDMEQPYSYDHHQKMQKPLFVRTDYYRQILNNFIDIKDTLGESEEIIYRLENLKKNADVEYSEFKRGIEEIQRKLIYVDKTLFEG
jgi:hypothetical protein